MIQAQAIRVTMASPLPGSLGNTVPMAATVSRSPATIVTTISTSTRYADSRTASPKRRRRGPDERNSTVVNEATGSASLVR